MALREFEIYEPCRFYAEFVRRAYDEFLAEPLELYRAKIAITQADILAERIWNFYNESAPEKVGGANSPRAYRQLLVEKECSDFQIVWDIHDGHKHVSLRQAGRRVTTAAQTGLRTREGAFDSGTFSHAFEIDVTDAVVILDDGSERLLTDVLRNAIVMWEKVLSKL